MNPLSQQALVDIVKSAGETPQYDCKAPMRWDGDKQSAGLAKDILACSNSRNGGILVIGKRELQPGEFEFTGVSDEEAQSFDTTKVASWINSRCDPGVSLACYQVAYEDRKFVVIIVEEFNDVPVISTRDFGGSGDRKKMLLKKGTIYVRTKNVESAPIEKVEEFRELIGLAVRKKADELMATIGRMLEGRSLLREPHKPTRFEAELTQANETMSQHFGDKRGFWTFWFHPVEYQSDRFLPDKLESLIRKHAFRTQYEEFPGSYKGYTHVEWGLYNELYGQAFGLTPSGLFVWRDEYRENRMEYKSLSEKPRYELTRYLKGGCGVDGASRLRSR